MDTTFISRCGKQLAEKCWFALEKQEIITTDILWLYKRTVLSSGTHHLKEIFICLFAVFETWGKNSVYSDRKMKVFSCSKARWTGDTCFCFIQSKG